ncbi:recombinase family protein [Marinomonas shanghaiensis]|uniref:recombinase family protein n=1 Tax=Marinomonas shanghaiensis TaxID=2202418 RepID=UPI003A9439C8
MKYGYVRVSTIDQNSERQLAGLTLDRVFTDKLSGKTLERPALQELLSTTKEGDSIHVHDISRLARNLGDLNSTIEEQTSKGVKIVFEKEGLTFSGNNDAMSQLMLNMLGSFYQFERAMLLERQKEGIAIAKQQNKYKGRQPNKDLHERVKKLLINGFSIRETARTIQCSTATVHSIKKAMEV